MYFFVMSISEVLIFTIKPMVDYCFFENYKLLILSENTIYTGFFICISNQGVSKK